MELTFRRPLNDEGVQRFAAETVDDASVGIHSFNDLILFFYHTSKTFLPKSHNSA